MVDFFGDLGASFEFDLASVVIAEQNLATDCFPRAGVLGFPSHGKHVLSIVGLWGGGIDRCIA